jgi:hypothetical protein
MFQTVVFDRPYEFGKWVFALKSQLWRLQLLFGGNWPKDGVFMIGGNEP